MPKNIVAALSAGLESAPDQIPELSPHTVHFVYAAEAYIQPIILIFGFLTNIASAVVLRKVRMNEVFRICLLSLSIVDALACAIGFVQLVVEVSFYDGDIPQGTMEPAVLTSNTLYFAYLMFMCASGSIVILIAFVRNVFVLKPIEARAWFTTAIIKGICVAVVVVTFVIFAPVSLKNISLSCTKETSTPICDWMDPDVHSVANVYVHYFIPAFYGPFYIIIYIICVICIRVTLSKSVRRLSVMTSRKSSTTHDRDRTDAMVRSRTASKITKTLLVILILDIMCTLPYVIQGIGLLVSKGDGIFDENSDSGRIYDVIAEVCLNLRPSFNFWLYVFHRKVFRNHVKNSILMHIPAQFWRTKLCDSPTGDQEVNPELLPEVSATPENKLADNGKAWMKKISKLLFRANSSVCDKGGSTSSLV